MSVIINTKRKKSVQLEPKSSIFLNKLAHGLDEKLDAKKKNQEKNKLCEQTEDKENNESCAKEEEENKALPNTMSINNEDKSKSNSISSSTGKPKPRGSFDASSLHSQLEKKKDFKINHIPSPFASKKDKIKSLQKNVYSGLSAAGRNTRGEVKINQDSFIAFQHVFNGIFTYYILGVFDGHGPFGHFVSDYLKTYFTKWFTSIEGVNFMKKWTCAKVKEKAEYLALMKKTYAKAEQQMIKSGIEFKDSGSTGIIIAILIDIVLCFNTGDSRAIYISTDGQVHQISEDHKPKNANEEKRITKIGGKVECSSDEKETGPFRVFCKSNNENGLAISRSIGDFEMKEAGVISDPDHFELSIKTNKIKAIVLGSDGIWDVLSNEDVQEIIEPYFITKNSDEASKELIKIATEEWLIDGVNVDDISAIVYFT